MNISTTMMYALVSSRIKVNVHSTNKRSKLQFIHVHLLRVPFPLNHKYPDIPTMFLPVLSFFSFSLSCQRVNTFHVYQIYTYTYMTDARVCINRQVTINHKANYFPSSLPRALNNIIIELYNFLAPLQSL